MAMILTMLERKPNTFEAVFEEQAAGENQQTRSSRSYELLVDEVSAEKIQVLLHDMFPTG
ncbi:hypothetical protein Plhal304r1_c061g0148091 [Plasmopara halstedii]